MASVLSKDILKDLANISSSDLKEAMLPYLSKINNWFIKYNQYISKIRNESVVEQHIQQLESSILLTEDSKSEIVRSLRKIVKANNKIKEGETTGEFTALAQDGVRLVEEIREELTGQKIIYTVATAGLVNLEGKKTDDFSKEKIIDKIAFSEGETFLKNTKIRAVASKRVNITGTLEEVTSRINKIGVPSVKAVKEMEQQQALDNIRETILQFLDRSVTVFLKTYNRAEENTHKTVRELNQGQLFEAMLRGASDLSIHKSIPAYGPFVTTLAKQSKNDVPFYKGADVVFQAINGEGDRTFIYLQAKIGSTASISIQAIYNALVQMRRIFENPNATDIVNFFFETEMKEPLQTAYAKLVRDSTQESVRYFVNLIKKTF